MVTNTTVRQTNKNLGKSYTKRKSRSNHQKASLRYTRLKKMIEIDNQRLLSKICHWATQYAEEVSESEK